MKKEDFCDVMGEIREDFILEAREKVKVRHWGRWGVLAACLCLAAVLASIRWQPTTTNTEAVACGFTMDAVPGATYFPLTREEREQYNLAEAPDEDDLGTIMGTVTSCVDASLIGSSVYHVAAYPALDSLCIVASPDDYTYYLCEALYASAADHLAVGDVEMAVAIWERLTDCDEEDRLEAVVMLAFCYPVLEEWECFDDAMFDVPMKSPEYSLLTLWCGFCRCGGIDRDALRTLRTRHKAWYDEFVAAEHPASEEFVAEIRGEHPSAQAEARELWFATEPLWRLRPEFIGALRKA